jgi:hypothetical protein
VRLQWPIKNIAYLRVPKCSQDSLELSVIKIESLEGLNHSTSTTKKLIELHFYHLYHIRILSTCLIGGIVHYKFIKIKITPFNELFWKIKIQQQKEMLSMHAKIPRVKKLGHLLPVLPLIPQKTTKMEEEKGFIAIDLKTRLGSLQMPQVQEVRQEIQRGQSPGMDRYAERLRGDLDREFYGRWH